MTIATTTPTADAVPKADGAGKLDPDWVSPIDNSTMDDMVQSTIKGRAAGAGTGAPQDLTAAQVKTLIGAAVPTVDNAVVRIDLAGGGTQESPMIVGDTGIVSGITAIADAINFTDATEATAMGTSSSDLSGGQTVAKRSFLGTIGTTFKGNVNAGVQDGTAAVSGQVGEVIESVVAGGPVGVTTVTFNITSISLPRGDWIISGHCVYHGGGTGLANAGTYKLSIHTTTLADGTTGDNMAQQSVQALIANGLFALTVPSLHRIVTGGSTTFFLTGSVTYGLGTPTVDGRITATRIR